ncbi:hypothetical protein TCDM_09608 [Trypanosoma cruzi Dm28c]|uniref:Uncharacterized protein n=1 Tax=Trypanosoma cruzi Dm28c TaxID=1416333 RepID=V5D5G6_TRYCR|nr:hypothetical protein TCDM_09608 [Trypanosoma cruzi Dm28c]
MHAQQSPGFVFFFSFFNCCFLIIVFYCFLNLWFAGRFASSAIALIPSVSWCVCCCWDAAICCCAWCSDCVSLCFSRAIGGWLRSVRRLHRL